MKWGAVCLVVLVVSVCPVLGLGSRGLQYPWLHLLWDGMLSRNNPVSLLSLLTALTRACIHACFYGVVCVLND